MTDTRQTITKEIIKLINFKEFKVGEIEELLADYIIKREAIAYKNGFDDCKKQLDLIKE